MLYLVHFKPSFRIECYVGVWTINVDIMVLYSQVINLPLIINCAASSWLAHRKCCDRAIRRDMIHWCDTFRRCIRSGSG